MPLFGQPTAFPTLSPLLSAHSSHGKFSSKQLADLIPQLVHGELEPASSGLTSSYLNEASHRLGECG